MLFDQKFLQFEEKINSFQEDIHANVRKVETRLHSQLESKIKARDQSFTTELHPIKEAISKVAHEQGLISSKVGAQCSQLFGT